VGTFETNVMGTMILLDQIKTMPSVKSVIVVTSDKCYQPSQFSDHRFVETDPMGGDDPYSASKAAAEIAAYSMGLLIKASRKASEIASCGIATVRAGNVIGGGDWASNRLIPDVMQAKMRNKIPLIRNPKMVRPWQHVFQPLYGYLLLAEQLHSDSVKFSGSWNFGPKEESEIPVSEVVRKIDKLWAETSGWRGENDRETPLHETDYLRLDSIKSIQELSWNDSVIDINHGLALTVDWYKAYSEHSNMLDFSLHQIRGFLSKISDSQ
jgi:CDP-glucose 4,6-dehydratase